MAPRRDDRFTALADDHIMQSIGIIGAAKEFVSTASMRIILTNSRGRKWSRL